MCMSDLIKVGWPLGRWYSLDNQALRDLLYVDFIPFAGVEWKSDISASQLNFIVFFNSCYQKLKVSQKAARLNSSHTFLIWRCRMYKKGIWSCVKIIPLRNIFNQDSFLLDTGWHDLDWYQLSKQYIAEIRNRTILHVRKSKWQTWAKVSNHFE